MAWISPTGHNDPDGKWGSESNAYDDDTGSSANNSEASYDHYLELTIAEILCDRVRIYAEDTTGIPSYSPDLDIDVYYGGEWHNIWSGSIEKNKWIEKAIGSSQLVTKAQIKSNTSDKALRLYEFDFNSVPPEVDTDACTDVKSTSFDANGDIVIAAPDSVTTRGFHYSKVFDGFEWGSDTDPLDDSGGPITWTITIAGTSKAEIDTAKHYSGTRSARLYYDGSNGPVATFSQSPISSSQVIAFRFRQDDATRLEIMHGNDSWRVGLYIHTNGNIYYWDGLSHYTSTTIDIDTWYLITIQNVDWSGHTYDIYLDGILIQSGADMQNAALDSTVRFRVLTATGSYNLDEVAVWDVEDESNSYSEGEYSLEITGLDPATTYYVQAFAENAAGFGYGVVVTCRTIIAKLLSDTVTIVDAIIKSVSLSKADSVAIADAPAKIVGLNKADTVTVSDAIVKLVSLVKADTVTITDSISKAISIVKVDTVTIADSISVIRGRFLNLFDTVTITDSLVGVLRVKSYLKQAIDRMGVKGLDAAKMSIEKMGIDQMAIKRLDIAQMQTKGMNIARMQAQRMGTAKTVLFRWIIRRWTA